MLGGEKAPGELPTEFVKNVRSRLKGAHDITRECGKGAQKRQKDNYDRKATGGRYKPGDMVWLYCPATTPGRVNKFHSAWKGPYKVIKVISDVVYRIQHVTPSSNRRRKQRLVVHFNRLKPCYSSSPENSESSFPSNLPDPPSDLPVEEDLMVLFPPEESTLDAASETSSPDTDTASEAASPDICHTTHALNFYRLCNLIFTEG